MCFSGRRSVCFFLCYGATEMWGRVSVCIIDMDMDVAHGVKVGVVIPSEQIIQQLFRKLLRGSSMYRMLKTHARDQMRTNNILFFVH